MKVNEMSPLHLSTEQLRRDDMSLMDLKFTCIQWIIII